MMKQILNNKTISTQTLNFDMDVVEIDEYFYVDFKNIIVKSTFDNKNLKIDNIIITFQKNIDGDKILLTPIIDIAKIEHDFQTSIYNYCKNDVMGDRYINEYIQTDNYNLENLKQIPLLYKFSLTIIFEYYKKNYKNVAVSISNLKKIDNYVEEEISEKIEKETNKKLIKK